MTKKTLLMATACALAISGQAFAQETPDETEGAKRLTTVTVTAQKREQDIQDVPISISAYGSDFIEESGVATMSDIALYSPNFTISNSSQKTNSRIAIRGVGSVGNAGIEPSVGVFIDGVYYPRPGSVIGNLIDLEAVEVLRGPQGTLFGRNTPMGALNVRTKAPSRDEFEAFFQAGYGSFDAYDIGGSISGPFSENVAGRLSVKYSERGGYGDNLLTGQEYGEQDDLNIRGKLLFDFADNFDVTVSADYGEINSTGQGITYLNDTNSPLFIGTLQALIGLDPAQAGVVASQLLTSDPTDHDIYQVHGDNLSDEQWGIAVTANYEFASGHILRSISSIRNWEADYFETPIRLPIEIFPRVTGYENDTLSQEFQFLSPTGETFEYLLGAFFYQEDYYISQDFNLGSEFCTPIVLGITASPPTAAACDAAPQINVSDGEFDQDLSSTALFGQGTWHANDQWSVTGGLRWTQDDKTADFTNTINNPFVIALAVRDNESRLGLDIEEGGDTSQITYFGNVSYFPVDDTMLFATVSSGYKSGGFNTDGTFPALTRAQRVFGPEDTTNMEVGIKSQLFGNTLQLNATLFRMDIEGFQDRAFDGISFITRNVGELRQQGLETDFVWAPLDQLTFTGGLSYLDSEFLDYRNASPLPGGTPQDLTGERAHFSPDWQGSLVADWTDQTSLFGGSEYFIRGETQYVGDQNIGGNSNQNPQSVQEAYQLFNARIGLRAEDDRWEVNLWGKNLGDEGFCMTIFDQPFGPQLGGQDPVANTIPQRCAVGAPQRFGIELKLRN